MKKALMVLIILTISCGLAFAEFPAVKVYEKAAKNVVLIIAKSEGTASMIGAGSIISRSGIICTNAHVVVNKATSKPFSKIMVYLKPKKVTGKFRKDLVNRHKAKVLAYDIDLDLAILKIDHLPPDRGIIELANPEEIKIGEEAVAIGHPEQGGLWTLTYGRISGEIEDQNNIKGKDVFQTDASVNRGNSGGPLLDERGYMIGINSNMARLGAGDLPITGVNFAVKSSVLKNWLEKQGIMIAYGKMKLDREGEAMKAAAKHETKEKRAATLEVKKTPEPVEVKQQEKIEESPKKPADKEKPDTGEVQSGTKQKAKAKRPAGESEKRYQPHHNAYNYDALLKAVEEELEDLIKEMRIKTRK